MTAINLVQGGSTYCTTVPEHRDGNLGNWGTQYNLNVCIKNDLGCATNLKGLVGANSKSTFIVLKSGPTVKHAFLGPEGTIGKNNWKFWNTSAPIANGDTAYLNFQMIHASKGSAPGYLKFMLA